VLRELSTPLIPISDAVVVMPLIGAIDSRRAQQVMETLLQGLAQRQAETAILDITGVPVVDTQVANALIAAAQAVKLLGATVVLTGIRPEVAQTLVGLGIDLRGIITRASLQSGITYALGRRQQSV
jgi:rsbT co-antagonist protein RsbR